MKTKLEDFGIFLETGSQRVRIEVRDLESYVKRIEWRDLEPDLDVLKKIVETETGRDQVTSFLWGESGPRLFCRWTQGEILCWRGEEK